MSRAEDSARLHQRVIAKSAKMLNLDVEHLTDAERVRVSMLSSVRLFDDRLQARLLAGQDVSSSDLQFVRNEMSRILGLPQEAAPVEGLGHPDSLQRLKDLIMARVEQNEFEENARIAELEAENAELRRALLVKAPVQRALPPPQEILPPVPEPPKTSPSPPT